MSYKILIVDDEKLIRDLLSKILKDCGYQTIAVADGKNLKAALAEQIPDLILLDYMLPDCNGHELCLMIREISTVPIIMITANANDENMIKGFDLGIDDFVPKPFKKEEILARVQAILRRIQLERDRFNKATSSKSEYFFGHWKFSDKDNSLTNCNSNKSVSLTEYEMKLLRFFLTNSQEVLSREQLYTALGSHADPSCLQAMNVYVYRLRNKIGKDLIQALRYKGYKLIADVNAKPID
jgi:DNA-binding response OmpR family regulator